MSIHTAERPPAATGAGTRGDEPFVPARVRVQPRPLGRLAHLRGLAADPISVYDERWFREPIVRVPAGPYRWAVMQPDAIGQVLGREASNWWRPDFALRLMWPLGEGLLTAPRPVWRAQRRALAPAFTPRRVHGFAPAMDHIVRAHAEALAARDGEVVDVPALAAALAWDVMRDALFGGDVEDGAPGGSDADGLMEAIDRMILLVGRPDPADLLGLPGFVPRLSRARARVPMRRFHALTGAAVARRRARLAAGEEVPDDMLTLLLDAADPDTGSGLEPRHVVDNVLTFVAAGHETVARALTWTLYLLAHHPAARERLEAEVDAAPTGDGAWWDGLPFARAVLDETLRLYPSAPQVGRQALEDTEVAGRNVRAGEVVIVPIYAVHRHRALWDEPDLFRPERFEGDARRAMHRYQYLPFGAGERVCIGAGFAVQEAVIALARLVGRLRFEDAGDRPTPVMAITLRPDPGLRLRVRARQNALG